MTDRKRAHSGPDGSTARAAVAAKAMVRAAQTDALLATCHWILADGTPDEAEARERMRLADDALDEARKLLDRVSLGTATAHEIIRLLRANPTTSGR